MTCESLLINAAYALHVIIGKMTAYIHYHTKQGDQSHANAAIVMSIIGGHSIPSLYSSYEHEDEME